ncbi:MAG: queuosine precursor transporter [Nanoarchaeota archaeon]
MINEILWFLLLFLNFGLVLLAYKLFGKYGLYAWVALVVILANIQVIKTIEIFSLVTAMGTILYSSLYLVTDILNEKYGKKDARISVFIGFFILMAMTIIMQITLYFIPHESDILSSHLSAIFSLMPRIAFASISAYLISQLYDVWLFNLIKIKMKGKKLWLRNNLSTISSQLIDNIIFTSLAFIGVFEFNIIIQIFIVSMIMKIIVALLDTPFIYIAKKIKPYEFQ